MQIYHQIECRLSCWYSPTSSGFSAKWQLSPLGFEVCPLHGFYSYLYGKTLCRRRKGRFSCLGCMAFVDVYSEEEWRGGRSPGGPRPLLGEVRTRRLRPWLSTFCFREKTWWCWPLGLGCRCLKFSIVGPYLVESFIEVQEDSCCTFLSVVWNYQFIDELRQLVSCWMFRSEGELFRADVWHGVFFDSGQQEGCEQLGYRVEKWDWSVVWQVTLVFSRFWDHNHRSMFSCWREMLQVEARVEDFSEM